MESDGPGVCEEERGGAGNAAAAEKTERRKSRGGIRRHAQPAWHSSPSSRHLTHTHTHTHLVMFMWCSGERRKEVCAWAWEKATARGGRGRPSRRQSEESRPPRPPRRSLFLSRPAPCVRRRPAPAPSCCPENAGAVRLRQRHDIREPTESPPPLPRLSLSPLLQPFSKRARLSQPSFILSLRP